LAAMLHKIEEFQGLRGGGAGAGGSIKIVAKL
jgi:hypothetical protein